MNMFCKNYCFTVLKKSSYYWFKRDLSKIKKLNYNFPKWLVMAFTEPHKLKIITYDFPFHLVTFGLKWLDENEEISQWLLQYYNILKRQLFNLILAIIN